MITDSALVHQLIQSTVELPSSARTRISVWPKQLDSTRVSIAVKALVTLLVPQTLHQFRAELLLVNSAPTVTSVLLVSV